ncbi:MAG: sulfatase-like hydrolase/transferase, partial [Fuerstiella sp.]|nr:sulfatase-like hydrolase/transferase [Fuerstiella sp.]
VVFSSDHGLSVGSHGLRGKQSMYEHTIGVPLLMQGPGIPGARRFDAQCYLRDLFPTLCDLVGIDGPGEQIDGVSLKPVLDGRTERIHEFIVGYFRNFQRMIRTDDWKYIEYPAVNREQLFHLKQDPDEQTNLIAVEAHSAVRERLRTQMTDWFRNQGDSVYARIDAEK